MINLNSEKNSIRELKLEELHTINGGVDTVIDPRCRPGENCQIPPGTTF